MAVRNWPALRAKLRALPVEVQRAVKAEMEKLAVEMVGAMRAASPRDTGELAASIGWTWGAAPEGSVSVATVDHGDFSLTIYAGSKATMVQNSRGVLFQKAKLMEFGTKAAPAHPYFFPVIRAYRRIATRRINAAARKAALTVWKK